MTTPPVLHVKDWSPDPETTYEELLEYPWKQEKLTMYGKTFDEPRMVMWYGPHTYVYAGKANKPMKMTPLLIDLGELAAATIAKELDEKVEFNSVFCNFYKDGDNYIGWHKDDEPGMTSPIIASISLGATRDFQVRRDSDKETWTWALALGDLVVMYGDCQDNYKHQLPKRQKVKTPRINLTYRVYKNDSN